MNFAAIRTAIYAWATLVTGRQAGITVYWDNPDAPRPLGNAVRIKLFGGPGLVGWDELLDVADDPDKFELTGPRTMQLSVNGYGDLAQQLLADLQTSIMDPVAAELLEAANISLLGTSELRDLSAKLETKWEQRFQMDVSLLATESYITEPGVIEEAIIAVGTIGVHVSNNIPVGNVADGGNAENPGGSGVPLDLIDAGGIAPELEDIIDSLGPADDLDDTINGGAAA